MIDISKLVQTDEEMNAIDNGAWIPVEHEEFSGVSFNVRGMRSLEAKKAMEKHLADARAASKDPLTNAQYAEVTKLVVADTCLINWKGLSADGKELKFNGELAKKFITGRGGESVFYPLVLAAINRLDSKASDFVEAVTKN